MSEDVTIVQTQENTIEFDLSIEGVNTDLAPEVRFVIQTNAMDMSFDCEQSDDEQWQVKIPAMSHLDKTSYPFRVEVIVDGYHFIPAKGNVQVTKGPNVKGSQPNNTLFKTPAKTKNKNNKTDNSKKPQSGKEEKTQRTDNSQSRQNTKQQTGESEQPDAQINEQQPSEPAIPPVQEQPEVPEQTVPEQSTPQPNEQVAEQPSVGFPTLKQTNDETPKRTRNDGYSIIKEAKRALNSNPELMKNHQQQGDTEKDVESIKQAIEPTINNEQLSDSEINKRIKQVLHEMPTNAQDTDQQTNDSDQPIFKKGDIVER